MEQEIKLPKISEGSESGVVSDIYVSEGDHVEAEDSILAVESDKATVDVPVEMAGTVKAIKVSEGDEISAGDVLIVLDVKENGKESEGDEEDDDEKEDGQNKKQNGKKPEAKKDERKSQEKATDEEDEPEVDKASKKKQEKKGDKAKDKKNSETDANSSGDGQDDERDTEDKEPTVKEEESRSSDIAAAPLAKKFARELGINIEDLKNGDPEKRITTQDVFAYAKKIIGRKQSDTDTSGAGGITLPDFSQWGETERKPMSGVRRATSTVTQQSWRHIPHVTHFDQADVTEMERFRQSKDVRTDEKITLTSIILKIVGIGLNTFPKFNASLDAAEKEIVYKKYVHIGVAVDTEQGLLLPVVRDVDKKSVLELSEELTSLSKKARKGKITPEEMKGGNFVISNLGGIGGTAFTPVIFPPQVAILGISKATLQPVYRDNEFEPRLMLPLSLSYDHRLIDGADAARFMRWVCEALEQPMNMHMHKQQTSD